MANEFLNFYNNNPTADLKDGDLVSSGGDQSNPISAIVNATKSEYKVIKLAVRTEDGYETSGDSTIFFSGPNSDKWTLSLTPDGTFGSTLVIGDSITNKNKVFYTKFGADNGELPDNDTSTVIKISTDIAKSLG